MNTPDDDPILSPDDLDREYNPRIGVDDAPALFARWQQRAASAQAGLPSLRDLAYGGTANTRLDLYPAQATNGAASPLLVFIHGGYWRSQTKENFSWVAPPFVERGIHVALVEYDLAPTATLTTIVAQVRQSLDWLHRHAADHGCAPTQVVVSGHSAGGHLALMTACAPAAAASIRGVVAISALTDLGPIQRTPWLDVDLHLTDEEVIALSPARLTPVPEIDVVCAVGALESSQFHWQQARLARHWGERVTQALDLPGRHHFTACDALAEPTHPLFEATLALLRR